jgi:RNA polymerase sigma-70 factor (ECF subfamily)
MDSDTGRSGPDASLVARAQAGDPDAMQDLIRVLHPALVRYCRYRLVGFAGGWEAADDAVQETCLAVVDFLPSYRDQGVPFNAWLFAIAAHKVADSQRRHGRAAVLVDDFPEQVETSPTPEELAVVAVELQTARGLIELLPPTMREVLWRRACGATAKTVAEELGMTAGAVNVSYHRAIARLRELVDESEEFRELFASVHRPVTRQQGIAI